MTRPRRPRALVAASLLVAGTAVAVVASPGSAGAAGPVGGAAMGSAGIVVAAGVPKPPDVADSFVVVNLNTGGVIAAKAAHARKRPASTLKTLTALVLLPRLDKTHLYTATPADLRVDGTRVGMIERLTYTVDDLFNAMLLPSANDATHGLVAVAGGPARVDALMTAEARHLQANDTTVKDPSGLDTKGQYTSAYDLALIGRAAMARPDFRAYAIKSHALFPGRAPAKPGLPRPAIPIENKNRLLIDGYPGMVGVKVGYTSQAGNTFIGEAVRNGQTVMVTLMHTHGEAEKAETKLLDWAFAHVSAKSVGVLVAPLGTAKPSASAGSSSPSPLRAGTDPTSGGTSPVLWLGGIVGVALVGWMGFTTWSGVQRRRRRTNPLGLAPLRRR